MSNQGSIRQFLAWQVLALAACSASPSTQGSGGDTGVKTEPVSPGAPDAASPTPTGILQPGPLSSSALDLVGAWTCSTSNSSTSYAVLADRFRQEWRAGSLTRLMAGDIVAFNTDRAELPSGGYADGFAVVQITANEGILLASTGDFGRLTWQSAGANTKRFLLADSFFPTQDGAVADVPTSYDIWDTCTRSKASSPGGTSVTDGRLCPLPAQVMITDFSSATFGNPTTLAGSEYLYPTSGSYALTSEVSNGNWHISGTIGEYSGFGLTFDNCNRIDASMFRGISFKISGSVSEGSMVTLSIGTLANTVAASWLIGAGSTTAKPGDPGRCIPDSGSTNPYYHPDCADARRSIPVTATPSVQNVLWADLTGGQPEDSVTPSDIVSIYWTIPWMEGGTPYPVDIVLDDLQFIF